MRGRNSVMVGIRISDSDNTILKEVASERGMSVSAFVKSKVEEYIVKVRSDNTNKALRSKLEGVGLKMEGNKVIGKAHSENTMKLELPICNEYNCKQFKAGDRVLIRRGKRLVEAIIPELDAEGNPM